MKKFFFRSLYLILPLILVMLYMEVNLAKIPNSYSYKRLCLEKQLDSIEVLILGSSQALYGLNPDDFTYRTFNLSDISQDLYYDHQLVMKYLDKMPSLRYAIISISYFSFGYSVTDGAEAWRIYYYSQFWDIKHPEADVMELKRISKFFLYTPNTSLLLLLNGFKANYTDHLGNNGYFSAAARKDTTGQISDSSGRKRVELHNSLIRENRIAQNRDQLNACGSAESAASSQ
ncbi:MAG: hypothetical protein IPF68_08660 [Bacteroidales bacterium]|nr:hypothetical protein [Bacteroidales bacterium]